MCALTSHRTLQIHQHLGYSDNYPHPYGMAGTGLSVGMHETEQGVLMLKAEKALCDAYRLHW